jgi:hypothetical protein
MAKTPKQIAQEAQSLASGWNFKPNLHLDPASVKSGLAAQDFANSIAAKRGDEPHAVQLLEGLARQYQLDAAAVLVQFAGDITAVPGHAGDALSIGIAIGQLIPVGQVTVAQAVKDIAGAFASNKLTAAQALAILAGLNAYGGAGTDGWSTAPSLAADIGNLVPQSISAGTAVHLLLALVQAANKELRAWEIFGAAAGAEITALSKGGQITSLQDTVNILTGTVNDVGSGGLVLNAMVKAGLEGDQMATLVFASAVEQTFPFRYIGALAVNLTDAQQGAIAGQIVQKYKADQVGLTDATSNILKGAATYPEGATIPTGAPSLGAAGGLHFLFQLALAFGDDSVAHVEIGGAIGTAFANHDLTEYFPPLQDALNAAGINLSTLAAALGLLCGIADGGVDLDAQYVVGHQIGWLCQASGLPLDIASKEFIGGIVARTGSGPALFGNIRGTTALNLLLGLGNALSWSTSLEKAIGAAIGELLAKKLLTNDEAVAGLNTALHKNEITDAVLVALVTS